MQIFMPDSPLPRFHFLNAVGLDDASLPTPAASIG
jgi:hypothetical protein